MRTDPGGSRGLDDYLTRDFARNIGAEITGRNKFGPQRGPWQDSLPDLPVDDKAMRFEVARDLAVRRLHVREAVIPVVSVGAVVDRAGSFG